MHALFFISIMFLFLPQWVLMVLPFFHHVFQHSSFQFHSKYLRLHNLTKIPLLGYKFLYDLLTCDYNQFMLLLFLLLFYKQDCIDINNCFFLLALGLLPGPNRLFFFWLPLLQEIMTNNGQSWFS